MPQVADVVGFQLEGCESFRRGVDQLWACVELRVLEELHLWLEADSEPTLVRTALPPLSD